MNLTMLKSKLHRATVTEADLNYEGSIAICPQLRDAAQLLEFERVEIYNVTNGQRFATYVIAGQPGQVSLNGAAARMVQVGDEVIIASYISLPAEQASRHKPKVVLVDKNNLINSCS